jgi:acetaldehyde dehydrogenase (acetylating)
MTVRPGRVGVAIIGPGNIGADLMYKIIRRSAHLELLTMVGIIQSEGITRAQNEGIDTVIGGIEPILENDEIKIVFDATGAKPHLKHAPLLQKAGKIAIDLTPAAVGPYTVPAVNLKDLYEAPNLNMVTCAGQATTPIVWAVAQAAGARYAEIVACIASKSAGPGTRQNIDEFTQTTAKALVTIGGARQGKAIIILNPAEPPLMMTDTVYVEVDNPDMEAIEAAVNAMVPIVQTYVPGYRLRVPPIIDGHKVTVIVEVEGAGEFLPKYSGNLDIMTSAAMRVGDELARRMVGGGNGA